MWLLPSRNRPRDAEKALEAFVSAGGSTPGILWVDGDLDGYESIPLPAGWAMRHQPKAGIAGSMRAVFAEYPDEPWYGWIADDNRPASQGFDKELIASAGRFCFVYCFSHNFKVARRNGPDYEKLPASIPSCMMWGGDLVRAVGWWAPDWLRHTCMDEVWKNIAFKSNLARYRPDVVVDHIHWKNGLRARDETDQHSTDMARVYDIGALNTWLYGPQFIKDVRKASRAMEDAE